MSRIAVPIAAVVVSGVLLWGSGVAAGEEASFATWDAAAAQVGAERRGVIELADAIIRIEVNSTDLDAGFQVYLDGEGWRHVWVYGPDGRKIFQAATFGGIREIGGGTELFLESEEPEFADEEEFYDLIELLDEGEYRFVARTTDNQWAIGSAELTHDVPAGPELVYPVPDAGEDCAEDVPTGGLVIDWEPVTTQLFGDPDVTVVAYEVIVESEDSGYEFDVTVGGGTTMMAVPVDFLEPGMEYSFEVLAIEESGNQTITESCFVTAE